MPDMHLGALPRPTDPAELRYALTRTLPPRAVDLFDASPERTFVDSEDKVPTHVELSCEVYLPHATFQGCLDDAHLFGGEFSAAVALSPCIAAFAVTVVRVLFGCAKEQVSRVHTERRITSMANIQAISDRPVVQEPTNAMRLLFSAVDTHPPIAMNCGAALPQPARIRSCDGSPKTICDRVGDILTRHRSSLLRCHASGGLTTARGHLHVFEQTSLHGHRIFPNRNRVRQRPGFWQRLLLASHFNTTVMEAE